ncbi:MAG: hypothetical protein EOO59_07925 [Hymenobacter sp.]|nr:MAG: hypothetical protein EOO59_07925 [Hymenobacter sp.]
MRLRYLSFLLALLLAPALAWAQAAVRGVVKDAVTGETLPGVTVLVKGTSQGTTSGPDGTYSLSVPAGSTTLVFSSIGYLAQELPVSEAGTKDINLKADTQQLNDVVVVGYGTVQKSDLTGSVATIKGSDLNKVPASSVDQLLQGKAAGLQVIVPSGEPGASPILRIRGSSSINGSNSPLVVVDGFPWSNSDGNPLKQINPSMLNFPTAFNPFS